MKIRIRSRARRVPLLATVTLVMAATLAASSASAAPASSTADGSLDVVAFNVLAPVWAAPDWYPADMDPALLDTGYRRERIVAFLHERAATADLVALQEVQDSEFPYLAQALGEDFVGFMSTNHPDLWANWLVEGIPWAPNGTAVFVRRSAFGSTKFLELEQSDGNSVAWVSARHLASGQEIRFASVHLDSDRSTARSS
jgi:mRNA deadenylase 3'-5' endonuclease subunit Ccr4